MARTKAKAKTHEKKKEDKEEKKSAVSKAHAQHRRAHAKSRIRKAQKRTDCIIASKRHQRLLDMVLNNPSFPKHVSVVKVDGKKRVSGEQKPYLVATKARLLEQAAAEKEVYKLLRFAPDTLSLRYRKNPDAKPTDKGEDAYKFAQKFGMREFLHALGIYRKKPRTFDESFDKYLQQMTASEQEE